MKSYRVISSNGVIFYYKIGTTGEHHREDGPAIIHPNGNKLWFQNGRPHREYGPAVEFKDYVAWYYEGNYIPVKSQKEFERYIEKLIVLL